MNFVVFIINSFVYIICILFLLRFFLQITHAPKNNPLTKSISDITNFAINPLDKVIPKLHGYNITPLILALVTQVIVQSVWKWMDGYPFAMADILSWIGMIGLVALKMIDTTIGIFIYAILIDTVLSWVNPFTPIAPALSALTRPILTPIRMRLPIYYGIDFSPLIAILIGQFIQNYILGFIELLLMKLF
jgi:YggT family protein